LRPRLVEWFSKHFILTAATFEKLVILLLLLILIEFSVTDVVESGNVRLPFLAIALNTGFSDLSKM